MGTSLAHEMSAWLDLPVEPVTMAREAVEGADIVELANNGRGVVTVAQWAYEWALQEGVGTPFTVSGG